MARILFLLIAIALVLLVVKRITAMRGPRASADDQARAAKPDFEKTQRCARCGAFIPLSMGHSTEAGYVCRQGCPDPTSQRDRSA